MAWFKRRPPPEDPGPGWQLEAVIGQVGEAAPDISHQEIDLPLLEARIADQLRDEGRAPYTPERFAKWGKSHEEGAWRRLWLAVRVLDDGELRRIWASRAELGPDPLYRGLARLAKATEALPYALIEESEIRAEEFARHLGASLRVPFVGETAEQSRDALQQIDYRRLLEAADRARLSAEDRLAFLRNLQEQQDTSRRRGKW